MAVLLIESFDSFSGGSTSGERTTNGTQLGAKYTQFAGSNPRFGVIAGPTAGGNPLSGGQLGVAGQLRQTVSVANEYYVSLYFRYEDLPSSSAAHLIEWRRSSSIQCSAGVSSDGRVRMLRGTSTVLEQTAASTISTDTWYRLEARVLAGNGTSGSWEVKLDGSTVLSGTGDTQATFSNDFDQIAFFFDPQAASGGEGILALTNLVVQDTAGAFLDNWHCEAIFPNGAGNSSDFTPSAGSNYQNVDEVPYDEDTTYNETATDLDLDQYTFADVSLSGAAIKAVQINSVVKRTDGATQQVRNEIRSGGTDYHDSYSDLTTSYVTHKDIHETDPDTATVWTESGLNAAEFGVGVSFP